MPGFAGLIGNDQAVAQLCNLRVETSSTTHTQEYLFNNLFIQQNIISKFTQDKLFTNDEEIFICTDGIMLNSKELRQHYCVETNFGLVKSLYSKYGILFVNELRGAFSGCLYNKRDNLIYLFTDHLGSKPIFYFWEKHAKYFIFGSELKSVTSLMKSLHIKVPISDIGAYCLLTFGYMLEDYTLVETVKRLLPGSILTYKNGNVTVKQYYRLQNSISHKETKRTIIATLGDLFTKAIKAEYDKDVEYGYCHIGNLSGGCDSRMNVLSAKKLGYKDLHTITYSQSNYYDERIAKSIADYFGINYIFYSLDNGNYLTDIAHPVAANDGLVLYAGSGHSYKMLSLLNWQKFGLLHTGILGDGILGTYLSCERHVKPVPSDGSYSKSLLARIISVATKISEEYENAEIFKFYNRGVNGMFNAFMMAQQFTEFSSPFLYREFLDYAIRIDPKLRFAHRIYDEWMFEYIPEATKFIWEKTGTKIGANRLSIYTRKVLRRSKSLLLGASSRDSMNPLAYWFKTNKELVQSLDNYFSENIEILKPRRELKMDVEGLFGNGQPLEKTQAVTLLAAIKLLGIDIS
jgi:asparagine synthase (glutamine-hydrolysing)